MHTVQSLYYTTPPYNTDLDLTQCCCRSQFFYHVIHWRSSYYAVMHMHNKNSDIPCRSPNVVKAIFYTIRNCS